MGTQYRQVFTKALKLRGTAAACELSAQLAVRTADGIAWICMMDLVFPAFGVREKISDYQLEISSGVNNTFRPVL